MSAALLVIDVQESFRHASYWSEKGLEAYLAKQNALIAGFVAAGLPVVRVFHCDEGQPKFSHFSRASGLVVPLAGSRPEATHTVYKQVHSALVDTDLPYWLRAHGVQKLVVSGIRTEQCCETTTRHGSDLGFQVDYVTEATLTFAMQHANGRRYTPDEIKERTELVLSGRFARICSVADVLAELPVIA